MQMKVKLLILLSSMLTSTALFGQVVFYNTGKMCVSGADTASTKLYIKGDFKAARKVGTPGCDILSNGGKVVLTGNLQHDAVGVVGNGSTTQDTIVNVFRKGATNGKLEFRGSATQTIKSSGATYATIPSKGKSYIQFPAYVEINNPGTVVMDSRVAGAVDHMVMQKGVFVLDSDTALVAKDYHPDTLAAVTNAKAAYNTLVAHLKVGNVTYANPLSATNRFQVNFAFPEKTDILPDGTYVTRRRVYGMGSPFTSIKSDYFMYNALLLPDYAGVFGGAGKVEVSPVVELKAGRGFIVGVDLRGTDPNDYIKLHEDYEGIASFNDRAKAGYKFNRHAYNTNPNNVNKAATDYTNETLVTSGVNVSLTKNSSAAGGYNYLANPFMAPISVSDLVSTTNASLVSAWGSSMRPGDENYTSTRTLMNRVWVLANTARAADDGTTVNIFTNYFTMKPTGGTYVPDADGEDYLIAPMQLFRVYTFADQTMTIPTTAITQGTTKFIRSASTPVERYDDFVFEVIDAKTKTTDRICVVLRESETTLKNSQTPSIDEILDYKNESFEVLENGVSLRRSSTLPVQSIMSMLYLENGVDNEGYVKGTSEKTLPLSTKAEPLYMTPSTEAQTIYIRGLRLNTMKEIKSIWLEDRKTGDIVPMTVDSYYETTSEPTDREDRFVLRFSTEVTGLDEIADVEKTILAYHKNNVTTIQTFDNEDFGSTLSIYDIQGNLVNQVKVTDYTVNINQYLVDGVYIVKVSGKNPFITKFVVK